MKFNNKHSMLDQYGNILDEDGNPLVVTECDCDKLTPGFSDETIEIVTKAICNNRRFIKTW